MNQPHAYLGPDDARLPEKPFAADDERFITCAHEAAHAVVGLHFGALLDCVEVHERPQFGTGEMGAAVFAVKPPESRLPLLLAGRAAEYMVDHEPMPHAEPVILLGLLSDDRRLQVSAERTGRVGCDERKAIRLLRDRGLKDPYAAFRRAEQRAYDLVCKLSYEIGVVATALYDCGRLGHDDVGWLMIGAQQLKPESKRIGWAWEGELITPEEREAA